MDRTSRAATPRVDLNADLGESFGAWVMGDDSAMFPLVTSANIACGFHAGDARTMLASCRAASSSSVAIGAHVGYRDLAGFGRRAMEVDPAELAADVLYQLAALGGVARAAGSRVKYVKPHGALYNRIVRDPVQAQAVIDGVVMYDGGLPVLGQPGSVVLALAASAGLPVVREAFVDRSYEPDGSLTPRSEPGSVLTDPAEVAARAVAMVRNGVVRARGGGQVQLAIDSLCVHGDTPGAVAMAAAVREALGSAGIEVRAFA